MIEFFMGFGRSDYDFLPGEQVPKRSDFEREKNDENGHLST
jgi:hypothetical protein